MGDEQSFADPTVNALCERVADLLGHEAAVFLPSGTMCNAIAFRLHVRPGGDEVVLHRTSHPLIAEAGGPAAISGAVLCPVEGERGMFDADTVRRVLRRPGDRYTPRSRLVSVEQTTNIAGGQVWPPEQMRSVLAVAREAGMRAHLDGARLMNAVVASGVPAASGGGFDTAWLDFTKGLGAPVGAVLAGSRELIDEAWRYKQMWGGAMRQAGIVAAAGLYALDHHVERLADDHENARALAQGLAELDGVVIDPDDVETNIVVFERARRGGVLRRAEERGGAHVRVGTGRVRAVTHLDVDRAGVERAVAAARSALGSGRSVTAK